MLQIKKALQLLDAGKSERFITEQLGLSRTTLRKYLDKLSSSELSNDQLMALSDADFSALIYGEPNVVVKSYRQERFDSLTDYFIAELKRVGVTRQLLWKEYLKQDPDGFGYSQFCERLNQLKRRDRKSVV